MTAIGIDSSYDDLCEPLRSEQQDLKMLDDYFSGQIQFLRFQCDLHDITLYEKIKNKIGIMKQYANNMDQLIFTKACNTSKSFYINIRQFDQKLYIIVMNNQLFVYIGQRWQCVYFIDPIIPKSIRIDKNQMILQYVQNKNIYYAVSINGKRWYGLKNYKPQTPLYKTQPLTQTWWDKRGIQHDINDKLLFEFCDCDNNWFHGNYTYQEGINILKQQPCLNVQSINNIQHCMYGKEHITKHPYKQYERTTK